MAVDFTYSVKWGPSATPYEQRMDKYRKYQISAQHLEVHWFSIINSCVTVLLLTGFLATILMRVLKNDFVKYTRDEEGRVLLVKRLLCGASPVDFVHNTLLQMMVGRRLVGSCCMATCFATPPTFPCFAPSLAPARSC